MAEMDDETGLTNIKVNDITIDIIAKIKLEDIHAFLGYMKETFHSKPATLARKTASIRVFFIICVIKLKKYLTIRQLI